MKGTLGLEHIGANTDDMLSAVSRMEQRVGIALPWRAPRFGPFVAEITKGDDGAPAKRYVPGRRDYSRANSKGSRGVYVWYILDQDALYLVHERTSWRSSRDYFCAVRLDGSIHPLTVEEAAEWLSAL